MAVEQGKHRHAHDAIDIGTDSNAASRATPFASKLLIGAIRVYQMTLSRQFPPSCRFYPSCSEYTAQAIGKYGAIKGAWLGVKRIMRCHPFHPGGYDPVP